MRQPAVIHACGVRVEGRGIPKSFTIALRHAGRKNERAGRKAIAAKQISATKMQFVAGPSEARGGRTSRYNPSRAVTIPSAHFCEPPPRKQASTGRRAMAALLIHCAAEMLARILSGLRRWDCGSESRIS